jgi:ribonuclease D
LESTDLKEEIKPATLVTAHEHLAEVCQEWKTAPRIAIDIESNGFYAYRERVCLVQISVLEEDYIIDPIAIRDLSPLGPLFKDANIQKLFHAGEYDILCMKRDYRFTFSNVFDTMIANRLLGIKELGLAAAIERHFGVKLSKKLQRADWGRRPLTQAQLQYAQMDTHYLFRLADIQFQMLSDKDLLEDAAEAFAALEQVTPSEKVFDPDGFWRLGGGRPLNGRQWACLKELYLLREREAQSRNRAAFRIMPEDLLLRLAMDMPETGEGLKQTKGMTPYILEKFGSELAAALERGKAAPPILETARKQTPRRHPKEWKLFEALRLWRKEKAAGMAVDPVVIVSSNDLEQISKIAHGQTGDPLLVLSPLKRDRYGAEIKKVIEETL